LLMVGILRLTVFSFYFGYWVKSPDALRSSVVLLSRYRVCVRSTPFSSFLRKLFSEKWTTTLAYRSFRLWAVRYGTPSSSAISLSFLAWMMICGRSLSFVRGIFYGIALSFFKLVVESHKNKKLRNSPFSDSDFCQYSRLNF